MPILRKKPFVPLPEVDSSVLSPETPVFLLQETGEIFLDYESYIERRRYLESKIFQCEFTNKGNLSFFKALESEESGSRQIMERFPPELKKRVLSNVQFQVMGRLDALVDLVFERYKNRYFTGEKVFVDLSGDKYFGLITKVLPPASIRESADAQDAQLHQPISQPKASTSILNPAPRENFDYDSVSHKVGCNLNIPADEAESQDNADEYVYTIQLMDADHKFEGSSMELKFKSLSRDRMAFSKPNLRRYVKECVYRDAMMTSLWLVKPHLILELDLPRTVDSETNAKNLEIREEKIAKRKKIKEENGSETPAKRRKMAGETNTESTGVTRIPGRAIKYPIEDLDLDPRTIHDGRILRRINAEIPPLPSKPAPVKKAIIPAEVFDDALMIWNVLNIFSRPLSLSPFSLDDFTAAIQHTAIEPRCGLLAQIHGCLLNVIATDTSRVLGLTTAAPRPTARASSVGVDKASASSSSPAPEPIIDLEAIDELEEIEEELELDRLVRLGLKYSARWDRLGKLKNAQGRKGWERHLIGALCQRGGPIVMPNLEQILAHLFQDVDESLHTKLENGNTVKMEDSENAEADAPLNRFQTEVSYLSLDLRDKLDILSYLCTLVLGSKLVRLYIDESESLLTEGRKDRADVNKERRRLLEEKAVLEGGAVKVDPTVPTKGLGNHSAESQPKLVPIPEPVVDMDDEEDQLADDDDDSVVEPETSHVKSNGSLAAIIELNAKSAPIPKLPGRKEQDRIRNELEAQLVENGKKDDHVEREFRRSFGVARCVPFGKDRFHNQYWWFDGIGGMSLLPGEGASHSTGRLYIQGPTEGEWRIACDRFGEGDEGRNKLEARQEMEHVDPAATLAPGEWGYYEDEEQIDALQNWLNGKGIRELALKNNLAKWRGYILAGCRRRLSNFVDVNGPLPTPPPSSYNYQTEQPVYTAPYLYLNYRNAVIKA